MGINDDILELTRILADELELPAVADIYVPPVRRTKRHADFGLVVLEDGSAGLFYVWLDDALERLHETFDENPSGITAWYLARHLNSADAGRRALAFGVVSAITRHFFETADFIPERSAPDDFTADDHVGMVGLFPRLVEQLRDRNVRLSVVEKDAQLIQEQKDFVVTLDPARLMLCNKILCTAATLLNDSLAEILKYCENAEQISVIGPSAGCLPDPLFARRVNVFGGSWITDAGTLLAKMRMGQRWTSGVQKYAIVADRYPGFDELLRRAQTPRDQPPPPNPPIAQ